MSRRVFAVLALGLTLWSGVACNSVRVRILMNEGNKLYKGQKYEEAIEEYKKILAIDNNNWDANYQIAMSYLALYRPTSTLPKDKEYAEKSIQGFERLLTMKAPNPDVGDRVRNYYVSLLRAAEKTDKAIAYYEGLLKNDPRNTTMMSQLAEMYAKSGDFMNALKYYEMRTQTDPTNKEAWYTVGVICWDRSYHQHDLISETDRAEVVERGLKALEKALALDPEYFDALAYINLTYREKAQVLANLQKNAEAGDAITKADEYQKKALDILNRKKAAAAAPKAAG